MRKISVVSASFFVLLFFTGLTACDTRDRSIAQDSAKAPDFTLDIVQGGEFSMSEAEGHVVILGFWATWCPPCLREIPHFEALHQEYGDEGLIVLGASVDDMTSSEMLEFIDRNEISYPVGITDRSIRRDYGGIRAVPTTFIVDRSGIIVEEISGYRNKEFFEDKIKDLL